MIQHKKKKKMTKHERQNKNLPNTGVELGDAVQHLGGVTRESSSGPGNHSEDITSTSSGPRHETKAPSNIITLVVQRDLHRFRGVTTIAMERNAAIHRTLCTTQGDLRIAGVFFYQAVILCQ